MEFSTGGERIDSMMEQAKFQLGQIVEHIKTGYRGVIVEVDAAYSHTEEWYEKVAKSRPPRNKPWYHVLVDNASHSTYVAERHLTASVNLQPINNPALLHYLEISQDGRYRSRQTLM